MELFALDDEGATQATSQIKDGGDVRELVCGASRVLMVTETSVGFWNHQRLFQLDFDSLALVDGPLTLAELARESVTSSGVATSDGWLLAFETRSAIGQTRVHTAKLATRSGFGIADGRVDEDASLARFDSSLPIALDVQSWGEGWRPELALAPQLRPLLVFIDSRLPPTGSSPTVCRELLASSCRRGDSGVTRIAIRPKIETKEH